MEEESQIKQDKNTSENHKLPDFIKILYLISLLIFSLFVVLYFSKITKISVSESRWKDHPTGAVFWNHKTYDLKTSGKYVVVEKGNGELGVLDFSTGELVKDTFFLKSDKDGLLRITPDNIVPAVPSFFDALISVGLLKVRESELTNPPFIFFILLPLVIALFAHGIFKTKSEKITSE